MPPAWRPSRIAKKLANPGRVEGRAPINRMVKNGRALILKAPSGRAQTRGAYVAVGRHVVDPAHERNGWAVRIVALAEWSALVRHGGRRRRDVRRRLGVCIFWGAHF